MTKKSSSKKIKIIFGLLIATLVAVVLFNRISTLPSLVKPNEENFQAAGHDFPSQKKVEDYFIDKLRMTPQEAKDARSLSKGNDGKVMLRLGENTTVDGLISNLKYYGFVRDEGTLRYALENTVDTNSGKTYALKIGKNTIDTWAFYRISEDMTTWEIANELLNNPTHFAYDEYRYLFMP